MQITLNADSDTAREMSLRFLDDARSALMAIVGAMERGESAAVAAAAHALAETSARIGARVLAAAAGCLAILSNSSNEARTHGLILVARSFAEVELEIERSLDRDVPLFI